MAEPTHRTTYKSGWKVAEFRIGSDWHRLPQRFSENISEAEVDGFAWAAREGYLRALNAAVEGLAEAAIEAAMKAILAEWRLDDVEAAQAKHFVEIALQAALSHLHPERGGEERLREAVAQLVAAVRAHPPIPGRDERKLEAALQNAVAAHAAATRPGPSRMNSPDFSGVVGMGV